ncbi:MAG: antibiotic biosynthesis monooxygenase [Candidatus Acidoferrum typicum]|nr:antibiotic biosynthesis monooxygenase [Candidatus Acidoferrum typicum]
MSSAPAMGKVFRMILEIATLQVRPDDRVAFEAVFPAAARILSSAEGYVSHELQRSVDTENRYVLLVHWQTKENHTVGFRGSPQYQEWRKLLHHFFDAPPAVEHYELISGAMS